MAARTSGASGSSVSGSGLRKTYQAPTIGFNSTVSQLATLACSVKMYYILMQIQDVLLGHL